MNAPANRIDLLEHEAKMLLDFLGDLPRDSWTSDSACEGWTVADVIGHLTSVDLSTRLIRGLHGDHSPPEGSPPPEQHDEDAFARSIYQRAVDANQRLGDGLLADFTERISETVALFRQVQPDQWHNLVYWPAGPMLMDTLLTQRIAELTMHGWDIRSRLEDDFHLSDGSVAALLDTVDRAARRAFRPDPLLAGRPLRYRFSIDRPERRVLDLILSGGDAEIIEAADGANPTDPADVIFECDGETCVLILYGRLTPDDAVSARRLSVAAGDPYVASTFGDRFVGG
ncbi:MAG: maleylpyruvate isomerase N-terminal domain-containing protein [Chloroflexota bacterium]|nr:maleylpyruvate isomerase N-terminal domain-containing protein [Chloroflexota bacterium]MDE2959144.1 maleylpyruvate isomerase N-terminal domain-containing protein [Chloroflexota bacterium]